MLGNQAVQPKLRDIAAVVARYGNFTFGGGSATTTVLREEIVEKRAWMTTLDTDLSFALSRLTPGTNLLAFCTAAGWLMRRWSGAVAALVAGSVPSSILAVLVTVLYDYWSRNRIAQVAMRGALAAAVAIMMATGWTLIRPYYRRTSWLQILVFVGGAFAFSSYLSIPPLRVLLLSAVVGLVWPQRSNA